MRFANRTTAGEALASRIKSDHPAAQVVIGLARGGVVVAAPIATALQIPLDVLVVKKIPSPSNPEFAVGALAPDNISVVYWKHAHRAGADESYIRQQSEALTDLIHQRTMAYRKGKKPLEVRGKTVIVVDDGAATGATLEAAIQWVRAKRAKRIIVGLPVASPDTIGRIAPEVAAVVVLEQPADLQSVGEHYDAFPQITDEEVIELLHQ